MSSSKQHGSIHNLVIPALVVVLIILLGMIAWQNIGPGKPRTVQNTQANATITSPTPTPDPNAPYEPTDLLANTVTSQANIWAGYVASTNEFKEVEGRVKIPTVTCSGNEQAFAAWVGFDGWNGSNTVEQAGITATCEDASAYSKAPPIGGVYYYPWAAMHGAGDYADFDFPVKPGDVIYSQASYADGQFTLTVKDETTGKSGTSTQRCVIPGKQPSTSDCPRTQAEWIVERPGSNQMARFGNVTLYDNIATTAGGKKMYAEGFTNTRMDMLQNGLTLARTGPLVGKGAFDVSWSAAGNTGD